MNPFEAIFLAVSKRTRGKRAALFRTFFRIDETTKILDLGSYTGYHIHRVLEGTRVAPGNVHIADIYQECLDIGHQEYGYVPVLIDQLDRLPFPDGHFDIVFCSSVIEHATLHKDEIWKVTSEAEFRERSLVRQAEFAREIQRVGKQYYVQTPFKYFPLESHTWLPFYGWLPRGAQIPILKMANKVWVKKTEPDYNLLVKKDMARLFPGAVLKTEKLGGLPKSIMAIRSLSYHPDS